MVKAQISKKSEKFEKIINQLISCINLNYFDYTDGIFEEKIPKVTKSETLQKIKDENFKQSFKDTILKFFVNDQQFKKIYFIPIVYKGSWGSGTMLGSIHSAKFISDLILKMDWYTALYENASKYEKFLELHSIKKGSKAAEEFKWLFEKPKYKKTQNYTKIGNNVFYPILCNEESLPFLKKLIDTITKFKWNKDEDFFKDRFEIPFSFCTIQNEAHREKFEAFLGNPNNIIWGKEPSTENKNIFAQSEFYAKVKGMEFYPKYLLNNISLENNASVQTQGKKVQIQKTRFQIEKYQKGREFNIYIYNRSKTSPIQWEKTCKILEEQVAELESLGIRRILITVYNHNKNCSLPRFESNLVDYELYHTQNAKNLRLNGCANYSAWQPDVFIYTCPDHLDPWPNTVFEFLARGVFIITDKDSLSNKDSGFYEMVQKFRPMIYTKVSEIFEIFDLLDISNNKDKINEFIKNLNLKISYESLLLVSKTYHKIYDTFLEKLCK